MVLSTNKDTLLQVDLDAVLDYLSKISVRNKLVYMKIVSNLLFRKL